MTPDLILRNDILEDVVGAQRDAIGELYGMWRIHNYRMLNVCVAVCPEVPEEKFAVAIAFHDLPVAIDGDLRYLDPAVELAREWLKQNGREDWQDEVAAMIGNHHKVRAYRGPWAGPVEAMRLSDRMDFMVNAGLREHRGLIRLLDREFPPAALRRNAPRLVARYALRHPRNPVPMLRW